MALLELTDLRVSLEDGTEIVKGVDLAVSPGEIHVLMGPNGSGKSSLAYALDGAIRPTRSPAARRCSTVGTSRRWALTSAPRRGSSSPSRIPRYAIPGVTVTSFLRSAINAIRKARAGGEDDPIPIPEFRKEMLGAMEHF